MGQRESFGYFVTSVVTFFDARVSHPYCYVLSFFSYSTHGTVSARPPHDFKFSGSTPLRHRVRLPPGRDLFLCLLFDWALTLHPTLNLQLFWQTLYGFLRLRIPSGTSPILPDLKGCALIRELHVYGKLKKVCMELRLQCFFWELPIE